MTRNKSNFFSLIAFDGGRVAFENNESGTIVSVGKIGKSVSHSIDNMYLVDKLHNNLLSVSQLCDKVNHVGFLWINA